MVRGVLERPRGNCKRFEGLKCDLLKERGGVRGDQVARRIESALAIGCKGVGSECVSTAMGDGVW